MKVGVNSFWPSIEEDLSTISLVLLSDGSTTMIVLPSPTYICRRQNERTGKAYPLS